MKRLYKKILTAVLACCVALSLAACAGGSGTSTATPPAGNSETTTETTTETTAESASPEGSEAQDTLARYDYVIDMKGNQVEITIATNLQSLRGEIKSMGLEFTSKCEIDGNVLKLTECLDGNEQVWKGVAAFSYTLHDDGTATVIE